VPLDPAGGGRDPRNPFDDRAMGLAMLGTILFCAATGAGIGVFFEQAAIGAIAGGVVGIVAGRPLLAGLLRDWR